MVLGNGIKLITIKSALAIPELGGITGPINNPVRMSVKDIIALVSRNVIVNEINPSNRNETVRLTLSNVSQNNFVHVPSQQLKTQETEKVSFNRNSNLTTNNDPIKAKNQKTGKKSDTTVRVTDSDFSK